MGKVFAALCLLVLSACQKENLTTVDSQTTEVSTANHEIPLDVALRNLDNFLGDTQGTRGAEAKRKVSNVIPIALGHLSTRSSASSNSNIIYAANFQGGKGYALLAADDRIGSEVIAVIDSGSVSEEDIAFAKRFMVGEKKPIVEGYPTTGPGIITVADYPGETFLNPNTFNPYEATDEDGWIGNFSIDNIGEEEGNGNLPHTRSFADHKLKPKNSSMLTLCLDYGRREVEDGAGTIHIVDQGPWLDSIRTSNLLHNYRRWKQGGPYNDLCPRRRKYVAFGRQDHAPVGCFPLALAKISAYFRHPNTIIYNGMLVDWDAVDRPYSKDFNSAVATLCVYVAKGCGASFFYSGTFTFPAKAASFMRNIGYSNIKRLNYTFDRVTSQIDEGCPVPMYGMPGIAIWNSHAWVIDGYRIKKRIRKSDSILEECKMVHCDFGWHGLHNGYYVDGIFRDIPYTEYDDSNDSGLEDNFNHHLRIIIYSNPRNK